MMQMTTYRATLIACLLFLSSFGTVSAQDNEAERRRAMELNAARSEGDSLFRQRKYRDAVDRYVRATELDSTYAPTFFNLGLCYKRLDNSQQAIRAFRSATRLDPMFGPAHLEVANVFLQEDRLEDAEAEFKETMRLLADSIQYAMAAESRLAEVAKAYANRAVQSYRSRDYDAAAHDAAKAMALDSTYSKHFKYAGDIELARQNLDRAETYFRAAVDKAEDNSAKADALEGVARVYRHRAAIAARANRTRDLGVAQRTAADYLRQAVDADHSNYTANLNLGSTLYELEEYSDAEQALLRAEQLRPRDHRAPLKLAETYMRLERCEDAEQAANRAIDLQRSNASAHAVRAEALECLGRMRDALGEYELARRDPRWRLRAEFKIKKIREELGLSAD